MALGTSTPARAGRRDDGRARAGWPGVLLHEAIGHGLEGDFNRSSSAFAGRIGERVAAKGVTVVDDGTLPNRRGSLNIDDEGNPTQCTTLIEDGILKGYIGHAERTPDEDAGYRQRAPRIVRGAADAAHDQHVHAERRQGSAGNHRIGEERPVRGELRRRLDITNGKFVFSASEAYMIENGKITYPVKGATLIGSGPESLKDVSMIGNDMSLDSGVGVCGKEGQSVPVGVGQPTLRIDRMTVGGTA